jgi:hypothetical protein
MEYMAGGVVSLCCVVSSSIASGVAFTMMNKKDPNALEFEQPEEQEYKSQEENTLTAAKEILKNADMIESKPNNGIKGRFIRISNENQVCMHISNVIVSTNKNDNIAYQKPVTISSLIDRSEKFKPSNVTDNDKNTYTHTSCGEAPWIVIDLQFVADIIRITVDNRQDCCQQRINGTIVSILGEDHETLWESDLFTDAQRSEIPVQESGLNQYGYDSFTMLPPDKWVQGERNKYY